MTHIPLPLAESITVFCTCLRSSSVNEKNSPVLPVAITVDDFLLNVKLGQVLHGIQIHRIVVLEVGGHRHDGTAELLSSTDHR